MTLPESSWELLALLLVAPLLWWVKEQPPRVKVLVVVTGGLAVGVIAGLVLSLRDEVAGIIALIGVILAPVALLAIGVGTLEIRRALGRSHQRSVKRALDKLQRDHPNHRDR
ncbi:hypothetical protein ACN2MM_12640 [Alkalilimnicola ehrlichii MLHE-1]|uniref:Uncharacterized protein n=1 Tax=Alkalilimnicola ehrlichii (strain ATCC BAA-1101 / DSM 17681 / MLHE-1) TaxID=187272 RepID=Q0A622_ALKEH|nr:hypothetical protein [Alkalilimnicola ehrlichii]ABI57715.1 hypothetical protein Mlg_2375 [Alkalilimnicola ehrlichii MLHE-1]